MASSALIWSSKKNSYHRSPSSISSHTLLHTFCHTIIVVEIIGHAQIYVFLENQTDRWSGVGFGVGFVGSCIMWALQY
jgi:hypothetical protein